MRNDYVIDFTKVSPTRYVHTPRHLQVHGGGSQGCIRMQSKQYEAGGLEVIFRNAFSRLSVYHRMCSRDNPSNTP